MEDGITAIFCSSKQVPLEVNLCSVPRQRILASLLSATGRIVSCLMTCLDDMHRHSLHETAVVTDSLEGALTMWAATNKASHVLWSVRLSTGCSIDNAVTNIISHGDRSDGASLCIQQDITYVMRLTLAHAET